MDETTTGFCEIFIPIAKIDKERREVWGRATQEIPDSADEIMDFASSLPHFQQWSEAAKSRTDGKSLGNVREMHQPRAAGKLISIQSNPAEKAIDVGAYISDPVAWEKCLDGTYSGFSIGGKYVRRWVDPNNPRLMRYTAGPHELSLVDAPAVPSAKFTALKGDYQNELRKYGHFEKIDVDVQDLPIPHDNIPSHIPEASAHTDDHEINEDKPAGANPNEHDTGAATPTASAQDLEAMKSDRPAWLDEFIKGLDRLQELNERAEIEKKQNEEHLKAIGSRTGIPRRVNEPLSPPKNSPSDPNEYGDPANYGYPVDKSNSLSTLGLFNQGAGLEKYSPREWHTLGRRIARMASRFGKTYTYDPGKREILQKDVKMSNLNKLDINGLLAQLQAVRTAAVDQITQNPQVAADFIAGNLDDLIAKLTPVNESNPSAAPTGQQEGARTAQLAQKSDDVQAPAGTGVAPTDAAEDQPMQMADAAPAAKPNPFAAKPHDEAAEVPSDEPDNDADDIAALKAQFASLQDTITKALAGLKSPEEAAGLPVAKTQGASPLANLNAIVGAQTRTEQTPLEKILLQGDPRTQMKEALELYKGDAMALEMAIGDMVVKSFVDNGIVTARRAQQFMSAG